MGWREVKVMSSLDVLKEIEQIGRGQKKIYELSIKRKINILKSILPKEDFEIIVRNNKQIYIYEKHTNEFIGDEGTQIPLTLFMENYIKQLLLPA